MKLHHPVSRCAGFRFQAWARRGMTHWRDWTTFDAALKRRMVAVFARRLASGGNVVEVYSASETAWNTRQNCFVAPFKHSPEHIAEHVAARVLGFGWKVRLA